MPIESVSQDEGALAIDGVRHLKILQQTGGILSAHCQVCASKLQINLHSLDLSESERASV